MTSPAAVSFLDAMENPALFGPWFTPEDSWRNWKTFARAVFGLPMEQHDIETFQRFTQRTAPPTAPVREAWVIAGRRGGKSLMAAALAVFAATFKSYEHLLKPGQRAHVVVLAADKDQAQEVLSYVRGFLEEVPALRGLIEKTRGKAAQVGREVIRLSNRVVIRVAVASFRRIRGRTIVCAILDELAFWHDSEQSANPAAEVLKAIRPSMLTVPASLLVAISSPYRRAGVLWEQFRKFFGKDDARVLVWKADTVAMNPSVDRGEIDRAFEDDPESARAEYGADFRTDLESYVSPEAVAAVTMTGRTSVPFDPRFRHFAFCDPAGGSGADSMTLSVARHEGNKAVECRTAEWKPPFSPETATAEAAEILKEYRLTRVQGDHFGGDWPKERFRAHGIAYEKADRPKTDIYQSLLPLINGQRVELLDHKKTLNQLLGLEKSTGRTGKDTITHAPGAHDDRINSLAGACTLALRKRMLEGHTEYKPPAPRPVETVNARGEGVVRLEHKFLTCPVCSSQHMVTATDGKLRPEDCPRSGWAWSMSRGPVYAGPPRTLETQQDEANIYNRSIAATMAQTSREIKQRGGSG